MYNNVNPMYKNVFLEMYKNVFCKFPNVPKCYPNVQKCTKMLTQCFQNVHFCTSGSGGVLNVRKCSAMYFNLYSTFPSAICYPFHFTWFLLLLSVAHCHSSDLIEKWTWPHFSTFWKSVAFSPSLCVPSSIMLTSGSVFCARKTNRRSLNR